MRLDRDAWTPLEDVDLLDSKSRRILRDHHVTTVEELLGQLEAVPDQIGELLELAPSQLESIREHAEELIEPELRRSIAEQRGRHYPLGALPPQQDR